MKISDLVKEVSEALRRHDPHVQALGATWPIVNYPEGVRKVVFEVDQGTITMICLGGARNGHRDSMPEQVVRNFGRQVIRIRRDGDGWDPLKRGLSREGAIDGVYYQDVEVECTKIAFGAKETPAISLFV